VLVTGLIARRLGADRPAQLLAGAAMAVAAVLLILGHLLSTATFDLLFWTLISFLVVRQLQGADPRGWLLVGPGGRHRPAQQDAGRGAGCRRC
jgi:type IV secretory pathway TrbD component